jgi:hypothetical protein
MNIKIAIITLQRKILLNRASNRVCMKGLLAVLTLMMGLLNGNQNPVDSTTSTTLIAIEPVQNSHLIVENLEKCDKYDGEEKILCYAKATKDKFFCKRLQDQELKEKCDKIVENN